MMRKFGLTVGIILMFLAVTIIGNPSLALAEKKFPSKPIYMVVGYKPGGGTDLPARGLASVAPEFLNNQPLIVVNKPGSSGMIASKFVANADPDGYTLLMGWGNTEYTFRRHLQKLPVDVFKDYKPVVMVATYSSCVIVSADSPFKNLDDLVAYARKNPGKLKWGHTGRGGEHHANALDFVRITGIDAVEIPYDGGPETRAAAAGKHVDFAFLATFLTPSLVSAGQIRVLGIALPERDKEFFPGYPGTPKEIIEDLHQRFKKAMEHRAFKRFLSKTGLNWAYMNPEDTLGYVKNLDQKYGKMVRELGLKLK
jgi:tripartite-type tricarboxylate transporter receptor subunit TctC